MNPILLLGSAHPLSLKMAIGCLPDISFSYPAFVQKANSNYIKGGTFATDGKPAAHINRDTSL
jgi:hypothetical protein